MSLLDVQIDFGPVLGTVQKLLESVDDPTILDEAAAIILNSNRRRFLLQHNPADKKWEPSKAAILRAKLGIGGGTLYDTGNLFRSIQLYSISPDTRAIGTDVEYGKYHMTGTSRLPIREFLGINNRDALLAESVVMKRIMEAIES